MRIVILSCWLLLVAGVLGLRPDSAAAEVSDATRQACTPDAMRLCADVIPDVVKVTACMKTKFAQLSEPCRVAMAGGGGEGRREGHHRHYRHHCGRHSHCG